MNLLEERNPHSRDKCISFQEEGHKYFINEKRLFDPGSGQIDEGYTSVTTFIHKLFPEFNSNLVIDKMMKSWKWKDSKYHGMSKDEIKAGWLKNAKEASGAGTKMHEDIEKFYNGLSVDNASKEWAYFQEFFNDHKELTPYRTEWTLWDEESRICGSVDMIFIEDDGTLKVYDWKRSKEIKKNNRFQSGKHHSVRKLDDCNYEHYSLQLNLYKYLIERRYGFKVSELAIVVFHPSNESYQKYVVRDLQSTVKELMKDRISKLQKTVDVVEVTELTYEGKMYLVDKAGNVIDEDTGEELGKFQGKIP